MTITLEIPKELESELAEEAAQLGLSLSEYALRLLSARPIIKATPKNGVDIDRMPPEVVTVYRTSKIGKYWRSDS